MTPELKHTIKTPFYFDIQLLINVINKIALNANRILPSFSCIELHQASLTIFCEKGACLPCTLDILFAACHHF